MNIFFFLGGAFLIVAILGRLLEKIRVPWIFAALFLGLIIAFFPSLGLGTIQRSDTFVFLANLGMYFLLFLIGYEFDIQGLKKLGSFIIKSTFFIIFFEAIFGSILIHYLFGYNWLIAGIVSLSFATVGEAMLIPILDEFNLTKTKLGQTILGIGTFDDVIEIFLIVFITILFPFLQHDGGLTAELIFDNLGKPVLGLGVLVLLTSFFIHFDAKIKKFKIPRLENAFFILMSTFFIFLGIANFVSVEFSAVGAIMAGIVVSNVLPPLRKIEMEREVKGVAYGFLAPIFFLWVGMETDVNYLISAPFLVLAVILVTYAAKILASYLAGRKSLGTQKSLIMGIALGVRFSTSIVIVKFLFQNGIIQSDLYSVLIGSTIAFKFIIPFILAHLIKVWKLVPKGA